MNCGIIRAGLSKPLHMRSTVKSYLLACLLSYMAESHYMQTKITSNTCKCLIRAYMNMPFYSGINHNIYEQMFYRKLSHTVAIQWFLLSFQSC